MLITRDPGGKGESLLIKKVMLRNFRCFEELELELNPELNIVVGDNDSGKSTLVEAINLALTFRIGGRSVIGDFSPYLINATAAKSYVDDLQAGKAPTPPEVIVDVFLKDTDENALLKGTNNLAKEDSSGVRVRASLSVEFADAYAAFISDPTSVSLVPTEYYRVEWLGFSGNGITTRSVPAKASLIDASAIRLQSGADYHLQNIINDHLEHGDRVELSRTYRSLRENFTDNPSVKAINTKLAAEKGDISDKELSLSIDISQRFTWESSLVPHLDDLPFHLVGKGEQSTLKILLALNRKIDDAHILLIEEPENHLSFSTLNLLMDKVANKCEGKQVLATTHSSYVLNKLGLESLILINRDRVMKIGELPADTEDYFKKLSGYDTLRVVLAKKVIIVEGPSDELLVQRAYLAKHGKLPIFDGVDVVNVRGLSAKRFLDLARGVVRDVVVVTDNDGKDPASVAAGFEEYAADNVKICVGAENGGPTLEPQLLFANSRALLNLVFGKEYDADEALLGYMAANKTTCALALFETKADLKVPSYIEDAVA